MGATERPTPQQYWRPSPPVLAAECDNRTFARLYGHSPEPAEGLKALHECPEVCLPGHLIGEALQGVTGLNGQETIDATNLYTERDSDFPSLSHQIKSVIGSPTAKSFSTVFAAAYEQIGTQRVTPSHLYAAEPAAKDITARLISDAGFDPVYIGDLDPGARLLEDSSALTRALAGQIGPFFYRYARPGDL
ncbi:dinucleotide-binding protein [Streptomyces sp. NPDC002928]|uniref:dinucleotide-binding protein n=1 Tax=Streptomyces sp. NPDC002928 TaxID=3154440 RepID=UPI0033AF6731